MRSLLAFHFSLLAFSFATVSQALPTNAVTRMATEGYVTNRVALGVASAVAQAGTNATSGVSAHNTNATAHASLFGETVKTNQTITVGATTLPLVGNLTFPGGTTNYVAMAGMVTGGQSNLIATALQLESDTLSSVASRGNFAGTETISPLRVNAKMFGENSGVGASGVHWGAFGKDAGGNVTGNYWGAFGVSAGFMASGDNWGAYGVGAGFSANGSGWGAFGRSAGSDSIGDDWFAFGLLSGNLAKWTNSVAIGNYAGSNARGKNRLYIDVLSEDPGENYDPQSSSMIYGDDGDLYLGRTNKTVTIRAPATITRNVTIENNLSVTGTNSVGALTLGGVPRSTWPDGGGVTEATVTNIVASITTNRPTFAQTTNIVQSLAATAPLAWTPIVTGAGGTVLTANVTTARGVYSFSTDVAVTLTNNLSAIPLNCTTNYDWQVWINYTSTNALSTVWDSRIEWQNGIPDLTVTGRYIFAFSTACGTNIIGRQVYPTVYEWRESRVFSDVNMAGIRGLTLYTSTPSTNYFIGLGSGHTAVKFSRSGRNNNTVVFTELASNSTFTSITNVLANGSSKSFMIFPGSNLREGCFFSMYAIASVDVIAYYYLNAPSIRKANELEIKAYNSGWRP